MLVQFTVGIEGVEEGRVIDMYLERDILYLSGGDQGFVVSCSPLECRRTSHGLILDQIQPHQSLFEERLRDRIARSTDSDYGPFAKFRLHLIFCANSNLPYCLCISRSFLQKRPFFGQSLRRRCLSMDDSIACR